MCLMRAQTIPNLTSIRFTTGNVAAAVGKRRALSKNELSASAESGLVYALSADPAKCIIVCIILEEAPATRATCLQRYQPERGNRFW